MGRVLLVSRLAALGSLSLSSLGVWAKNPTFLPSSEAPHVTTHLSRPQEFSVGLSFSSIIPLSTPYSSKISGTAKDVRFQMPTAFSIEAGFQILDPLEIALSAGYQSYESRVDIPAGANSIAFQTVKLKSFPIMAIARYRFGDSEGWAPEAEAGLGLSFATLNVKSTNLASTETNTTMRSLTGYGAFGAGFSWLEDYSVHLSAGFGMIAQGTQSYASQVTQKTLFGVFSKALLRYQF